MKRKKNGDRKICGGFIFGIGKDLEKENISDGEVGRSRKYRKMFGKRHLVMEEKKNIEGREGKYLGTKKLGEGRLDG